MDYTLLAEQFFNAVISQNADALRGFFAPGAEICWYNTNELFTVEEYIRANCEYPGKWHGHIERIELSAACVVVAKVWGGENAFRVVSFIKLSDGKIERLDEYWGDIGSAPEWRRDMKIGRAIRSDGGALDCARNPE